MSKQLPKATQSTLSDIRRRPADPAIGVRGTAAEVPDARGAAPVATQRRDADAELQRAEAINIVERYTTYAALGGCIPLTIVNGVSVSLIILNMVRTLAAHYDVPFRQDQVKTGIAALIGGFVSPSLGGAATKVVGLVMPGGWLLGAAASSAGAAACARYAGHIFIEHFELGGTTLALDIVKV